MEYEEFRFVQVEQVDWSPPTPADVKVGITVELVGGLLTLIKVWRTRTQQEIDDNNAELRQEDIDDYLSDKSTTIVFELAKQIIPGLTKGQFSTFVHNKWPII